MKLSRNFSQHEFDCKCGGKHASKMDMSFISKLQELRDRVGFALVINSGFRCPEWNEKIGGSPNSQHMLGIAVDIKCTDIIKRAKIIKEALNIGFSDVSIASNFIHIDNRPLVKQRTRYYN